MSKKKKYNSQLTEPRQSTRRDRFEQEFRKCAHPDGCSNHISVEGGHSNNQPVYCSIHRNAK